MTPLEEPPPYRPGIGSAPAPLFGRDDALHYIYGAFRSADRGYGGTMVRLLGLRGTGKTTLLGHLEEVVTDMDRLEEVLGHRPAAPWIVVRGEASPDLDLRLIDRIARIGQQLDPKGARWNLSVGASAGIASMNLSRSSPDDPTRAATLYGALRDLAEDASRHDRPILVLVDELQAIREDTLGAITSVANERAGSAHPLVLVTAELPNRLDLEHLTYFRDRAQQITVSHLDMEATRSALTAPAKQFGVSWDRDALDLIARASTGYPYAIQVYGHAAWEAAEPGDRITMAAAQAGKRRGYQTMSRLYESRWETLTPRLQQYMGALAHISPQGRPVPTASVPEALADVPSGRSRDLATLRDRYGAVIHTNQKVRPSLPGWSRWIITLQRDEPFLDADIVERTTRIRERLGESRGRIEP